MRPAELARRRWGRARAQRGVEQCLAVMAPHEDNFETDEGLLAAFMVSGIALLVHAGAESPAALASAIKKAALVSGIPEAALEAQARFTALLLQGSESE